MFKSASVDAEAAAWLLEVECGELTAERRVEFEAWLRLPVHQAAYIRLEHGWRRSDRLRVLRRDADPIDADLLELASSVSGRGSHGLHWPRWPMAAFFSAVFLGLTLLVAQHFYAQRWDTYETRIGDFQRVLMSDGSVVLLNSASALRVRVTAKRRDVRLLSGEANFQVAHDPRRPFEVDAGTATVRAVGTQFSVRRQASGVAVVVTQGRVQIETENSPAGVSRARPAKASAVGPSMLEAGEVANVVPGRVTVRQADATTLQSMNAWMQNRLWFERAPLSDVVAQFNRFNSRQIVIADPLLNELRVGGGFEKTDVESFLAALTRTLSVRVDATDPTVYRLYRNEP